jgi:hypothetical protein
MGQRHLRLKPSWTATLGALHDEGGLTIRARCRRCEVIQEVDLTALIAKVGRDYSLWDRHPPCKLTPECCGRIVFSWSTGTWMWMFESDLYL